MGSFGATGRLDAFRGSVFNNGLSLVRSDIRKALGVWKAADAAVIRQGQFVMLTPANEIDLTDGKNILGVSKWNKITSWQAVNVDEVAIFASAGGTYTVLKPQTISNVAIRSAPTMGGTAYANPGDFSFTANGVITQNGGGTIPVGVPVYVTYTYQMTQADQNVDGFNFLQSLDDVTLHEGRITVITDWAMLFTAEYDTSQTYTLQGAGSNLYVTGPTYASGGAGILTNVAPTNMDPASGNGVGRFVGKVSQLPQAEDAFLGVLLGGHPIPFQPTGAAPSGIVL